MEIKEQVQVYQRKTLVPKNRTITLIVKAKDLFGLHYPPSETQIDDCVSLLDDEGYESRFGASSKNYTTDVYTELFCNLENKSLTLPMVKIKVIK